MSPTSPSFTCSVCGQPFSVPEAALRKYPGWTPRTCLKCRDASKRPRTSGAGTPPTAPPPRSQGQLPVAPPPSSASALPAKLPSAAAGVDPQAILAQVTVDYAAGPHEGVFTDGACSGNPGPGGWAAVRVHGDQVQDLAFGQDAPTTNNRMELTALIAGYRMIAPDEEVTIWSDSQLCVNTINQWAARWEKNGWRRKGGEIKNLELVKEAYALSLTRPRARLQWIKAHNGSRWNEYADRLATAGIQHR